MILFVLIFTPPQKTETNTNIAHRPPVLCILSSSRLMREGLSRCHVNVTSFPLLSEAGYGYARHIIINNNNNNNTTLIKNYLPASAFFSF